MQSKIPSVLINTQGVLQSLTLQLSSKKISPKFLVFISLSHWDIHKEHRKQIIHVVNMALGYAKTKKKKKSNAPC